MSWRIQDGAFSGAVNAIAETKDAYLWIGTESGLLRFDGVRFLPFEKEVSSVVSLLADGNGNLWIGTIEGLDRLDEHGFHQYPDSHSRVNAIRQTPDGKVWIVRSRLQANQNPVCEASLQKLHCYGSKDGISFRHAELLDVDDVGNLLVGSGNTVLKWNQMLLASYVPDAIKSEHNFNGLRAILSQPDHSMMVGMATAAPGRGLQKFDQRKWADGFSAGTLGSSLNISALYRDREKSLWIGTSDDGLLRISARGVERFRDADGLTGNFVGSIYEDTEGNIWVATTKGLDCFRHLAVTSYSLKEGLEQESVESVANSKKGGVWIGNRGGLAYLDHDEITTISSKEGFPGERVTSLFEDHDGDLWVGVDANLYLFHGGHFSRAHQKNGEGSGVVVRITETDDHTVYVLTTGPPYRLSKVDKHLLLSDEVPLPEATRIWDIDAVPGQGLHLALHSTDGPSLSLYKDGKIFLLSRSSKILRPNLTHSEDGSTWGNGINSVFRWKSGRIGWLSMESGLPCDHYYSAIQDHEGNLWLYARCGLIEVEKAELGRWWSDTNRKVTSKLLDAPSGTLPALASFTPSSVQASDGRLFFANGNDVQELDPSRPLPYADPPPVHIEEIHVNRQNLPIYQGMRLAPLPRDLEFVYTGLCLSVPQKVNFRYKLDGHDADWQDAGTRRQAFYTDLHPGRYRFRVVAEGSTGLWNTVGDSLVIVVPAAWYQTRLFVLGCALLCIATMIGAYHVRVRQIKFTTQSLYDERLAERTRIARDIHDTLLQTLQGSKMIADDALDREADVARLKSTIRNLSDFLARAMREGRAALQSLRESTKETSNLAEAFQSAIDDCRLRENMSIVFSVEGAPRRMHPIARDEIYRIGYEAIKNACRHSEGSLLEVTLAYGTNLVLQVKDDGRGIDAGCLETGRDGHYGLSGMKERAERISAQLTIRTKSNVGTEIVLKVPASSIFDEGSSLWVSLMRSFGIR